MIQRRIRILCFSAADYRPVAKFFLWGGAIHGGDGPSETGGEGLGCLRLALLIVKSFFFFQIEYVTLKLFRMAMPDVTKVERK